MNAALVMLLVALAGPPEDFRAKVAPILETKCIRCHGEVSRKGELALHTAGALAQGGESGPSIEPGKAKESLLIAKITGDPPEMPRGGKPLTAEEVSILARWIDSGAEWPKGLALKEAKAETGPWWAIQPLKMPSVPVVKDERWIRSPIDSFVLANLEAKGLSPSAEADRTTLIRRLSYDLHGLPPSPEEVRDFLQDARPDAYGRLADRLLASPRYGERWGRHWLDVGHYGDTHGYDKDKPRRNAWRYRDYVINALNDDMPYARFVREQVAGDVLSPEDPGATIATGFLAAGPWDFVGHAELREGTVDKEKTRLIDRDDVLANVMSTFTSLTVHCARCHDHKFDPIPQTDYYRLQAVFAGIERGDRQVESRERAAKRLALEARGKAASETHRKLLQKASERTSPELKQIDEQIAAWRTLAEAIPRADSGPSPTNGYHSAIFASPDSSAWVQVDLGASVPLDEIRILPARPTDFPDTPGFGFPLRFEAEVSNDPGFATKNRLLAVDRPGSEPANDDPVVIRPRGQSGRYVRITATRLWERTKDYVFALSELEVLSRGKNVALARPVTAISSIEGGRWGAGALVDGYTSRSRRPSADDPDEARRLDLTHRIAVSSRERERLAESLIPEEVRKGIEAAQAEIKAIAAEVQALPPVEMVYAPLPRAPRPIHRLKRGDVEQPAEPVGPGALSCVPGLANDFASSDEEGARRSALALWLVDRENVLTWRSIVNRVWSYHFGRGIVDTPNDFGRNGGIPTHPELLDWLAVEFRDGGGSLKSLHRKIVTSATYRQSSADDPRKAAVDADNRTLWRQNRRRLEAEAIRDSVLSVAGDLDLTMGGPGFEPFRFKDDHSPIYDHEDNERLNAPECRRRAVYRFAVRSVPNPFVECLDGADPNAMTPVRNTTITALQALTLMNDPFMIRESEAFATRLAKDQPELPAQIDRAYSLLFSREPRPSEKAAVILYAKEHGLARACRILFNTNEFVFAD